MLLITFIQNTLIVNTLYITCMQNLKKNILVHAMKTAFTGKKKEDSDYVDIDQHDEYVDPEELMVGETGSTTGDSIPPTSPSSTSSSSIFKPLPSKLGTS